MNDFRSPAKAGAQVQTVRNWTPAFAGEQVTDGGGHHV